MDNYRDIFRFVVELTDSKAMSAAYFVLVSTCITAHTHFHRKRYLPMNNDDTNNIEENELFSPILNYNLPVSTIKIYYLDGCHISLDVNDTTTMKEICMHICLELKLGLYEVQEEICALNEQKLLPASMNIGELIHRWKILQWPDAKLVAPVYLQEWSYRANSKTLRRVRFENSYLTHSYYNSPSLSLNGNQNSPFSTPNRSPNRNRRQQRQLKINNIDNNTYENNDSNNNSITSTPNHSEPTTPTKNSPSFSSSTSTRARERTHALLNSLFMVLPEDTNRRYLSTTARDRNWENSLRRKSPLRGRLGHSPSTTNTGNATGTGSTNVTTTPLSTPQTTIPSGVNGTHSFSSSERRNQSILPSPDTVRIRSPNTAHHSNHHTNSTSSDSRNNTTNTSAEYGTYLETPDKVRPNTTYVRLSNDSTRTGSRSSSPILTNSQNPYATEGRVMDMGQGESPSTTASTGSAATVGTMSAPTNTTTTTTTNTTTNNSSNTSTSSSTPSPSVLTAIQNNSIVDDNIHRENVRTNALLHRLFDSMRDNIDETCTPKPITTDDEATSTPHSRIYSNSHTSKYSRSGSPTGSVGSGSGSVSSTNGSGHRRHNRRTTPKSHSPHARPPFDASTKAPTLSMLLALGQNLPDVKSPHILLEKETEVMQHRDSKSPEGRNRWRRSLVTLPLASSDDESPSRSRNSLRSRPTTTVASPASTTGIISNSTTPTHIPVRTRLFSRRNHTTESISTSTPTPNTGNRRAVNGSPLPSGGTPVRSIRTPTTTGTQSRSKLKSPNPRSINSSLYPQPEFSSQPEHSSHNGNHSVAEALDCIELRISRDSMDDDRQLDGISPNAQASVSEASRTCSPSSAASHSDYASTARRYGRNGHRHPHNTSANSMDTTHNKHNNNTSSSNKKKNIAFMRRDSTIAGNLSGEESSTSGMRRPASPYNTFPHTTTIRRRESKRPLKWIP